MRRQLDEHHDFADHLKADIKRLCDAADALRALLVLLNLRTDAAAWLNDTVAEFELADERIAI